MKFDYNKAWTLITIFCIATWVLWFFQIDIRSMVYQTNPISGIQNISHNLNPSIFDCKEDWECFKEKLLFCEKATVNPPNATQIGIGLNEAYATETTSITVEKWKEEYVNLGGGLDGYIGYCYTIVTDLNARIRGLSNWERKKELWEKARCKYRTNPPGSDEFLFVRPSLQFCNELKT